MFKKCIVGVLVLTGVGCVVSVGYFLSPAGMLMAMLCWGVAGMFNASM